MSYKFNPFTNNLDEVGSTSGFLTSIVITNNTGSATWTGTGSLVGSGSLTFSGSGSTVTGSLTGLTNHALLVGAGTATITKVGPTATAGQVLQSGGSAADPVFSTATYPATTTINQILYSSATNVVGGITAVIDGVLISNHAAGVPSFLANGTAGFVLTAQSGAPPAWAASGLVSWAVITADQTAVVNKGYVCNKATALVLTLPSTAAIGDIIEVTGINTALGWKIAQNANQQIFFGNASTTVGVTGFIQSAAIRDSAKLLCVVAGASTVWNVISSIGNITVS